MFQTERSNDFQYALQVFIQGMLNNVWTCMPGIVEKWDPDTQTVQVQPTIRGQQFNPFSGEYENVKMSLLIWVPVVFAGGGGISLVAPPKKDDECLVWFASRCIDAWWVAGEVQNQLEFRVHSLDDGFCLVGPRSLPNIIPNMESGKAALRTDSGDTELGVGLDGIVTIKAPGGIEIDGQPAVPSIGSATVSIPVLYNGELVFLKASTTP